MQDYEHIKRHIASAADRSKVLGVTRPTIRNWDDGNVGRLWGRSRERLQMVRALLVLLGPYFTKPTDAGAWVQTPQPQYRGQTPLDELRRRGRAFLEDLEAALRDYAPAAESRPVDLPPLDDVVAVVREELGDETADRVAAAVDRAQGRRGRSTYA